MKIKAFSYYNKITGWNLEPINFNDFTLLVGISGVGKSKILRAMLDIKSFSEGKCLNGIKWNIVFETTPENEYTWEGEFESNPENENFFDFDDDSNLVTTELLYEKLSLNGSEIFFRDRTSCQFQGQATPKLSKTESLIFTLKEENAIEPIAQGFKRVIFNDQTNSANMFANSIIGINQLAKKYDSSDKIISSDLNTVLKLTLVYKNDKELFQKLKERYCEIFPNVEDIKIEPLGGEHLVLKELPILQIKERCVKNWIPLHEISSGMVRTLKLIGQAFLCPQGSVILIDEFENSLGVNCINILTDEIFHNCCKTQFILTSHHPYIINAISMDSWKLIRRTNSNVSAVDISSIPHWPKSSHEAFIKLVNLPEFEDGITCE